MGPGSRTRLTGRIIQVRGFDYAVEFSAGGTETHTVSKSIKPYRREVRLDYFIFSPKLGGAGRRRFCRTSSAALNPSRRRRRRHRIHYVGPNGSGRTAWTTRRSPPSCRRAGCSRSPRARPGSAYPAGYNPAKSLSNCARTRCAGSRRQAARRQRRRAARAAPTRGKSRCA